MRDALRLSAHVVSGDPSQLAGQLVGRLRPDGDPGVAQLVEAARARCGSPWLRPASPTLTAPGGPLQWTLPGHRDWVTALAVTSDGRFAASGSFGWIVSRWDLEEGLRLDELRAWPGYSLGEGHGDEVRAVGIGADGSRVAAVTDDSHVRWWDTSTGESGALRRGNPDEDWQAAMTPDGRRAAGSVHFALVDTGGEASPGAITVWDLEADTERHRLAGHQRLVDALAFSFDGRKLVSATRDGVLQAWDVESGAETCRLDVGAVSALAVDGDGSVAAVAEKEGGAIALLDLDGGRTTVVLEGSAGANALAITPDARIVAAAGGDGAVRIWAPPARSPAAVLRGHSGPATSVACTPDGGLVLSGGADRTVRVWEPGLGAGEPPAVWPAGEPRLPEPPPETVARLRMLCAEVAEGDLREVLASSVGGDGRLAATATREYQLLSGVHELGIDTAAVRLWDLEGGRQLRVLAVHRENVYGFGKTVGFRSVAMTGDGALIAAGDEAGVVTVWRLDGTRLAAFTADGAVDSLAWDREHRLRARDVLGSLHVLELAGERAS